MTNDLKAKTYGENYATQKCIIKLQSRVRGSLARSRVRRIHLERQASKQGVLIAAPGTIQGQTGWYCAQELMFYFCKEFSGEFTLICGPISKDMFNLALSELKMLLGQYYPANQKFPKTGLVDRLCIHATRIQIETLMDEIKDKDLHINELYGIISQLKINIGVGIGDIHAKHREEVRAFVEVIKGHVATIQKLEYDKMKLNSELDLAETKIAQTRAKSGPLERVALLIRKLSKFELVQIVKFQAAIRGYICRARVLRTRNVLSAKQSGVLIAMKHTIQGESGWYLAPNGSVFYFVLDNGDWINSAGPIDMGSFEAMILDSKRKNRISRPGVLVKCPFNLSIDHEDIRGDIYMANNQSAKIFVAVPVENLVKIGQNNSLNGSSIISYNDS